MKKIICALALSIFMTVPASLSAQTGGGFDGAQVQQGGFVGNSAPAATVAQALKMRDDSWVGLTGRISKQVGDEKYSFSDGTGTIIVDIDNEDWHGLVVGPSDTIYIEGELDKDFGRVELDVHRVSLR